MPMPPDPATPKPPRLGGGCLIAAGLLLGPIVGLMFGQTSLGLVIGFGIGVALAIALTLYDRR
jgi:hypothetical protein